MPDLPLPEVTLHYQTAGAADMARDTLALMDALDHQRFHVAGQSMGGLAALELAGLAGAERACHSAAGDPARPCGISVALRHSRR